MTKDYKSKKDSDSPLNDTTSWILAGIALGLLIGLLVYIFAGQGITTNTPIVANDAANRSPVVNPDDSNNNDLASKDVMGIDGQKQTSKKNKMEELDKIVSDNLHNVKNDNRPTFDYHVILPTLDIEVAVAKPTDWQARDKHKHHKKEDKKKESASTKKSEEANKPKKEVVEKITKPGNYIIQVGAYKKEPEALRMKQRVSSIGIRSYVEKASVKGATWYRVRVGPMSNLNKINDIRNILSSKGIASFKKAVQ